MEDIINLHSKTYLIQAAPLVTCSQKFLVILEFWTSTNFSRFFFPRINFGNFFFFFPTRSWKKMEDKNAFLQSFESSFHLFS